jgi:hypothetical protein
VIAAFSQRDAGIATPAPVPIRGLVVGVYTSSQIEKCGNALPVGSFKYPQNEPPKAVTKRRFHRCPQASFHSVNSKILPRA